MSTMSEDRTTDRTERLPRDGAAAQPDHAHAHPGTRWDPTLWVAIVAGAIALFALVVGIVTLARTGLPAESITGATTEVGAFSRSALMGLIEIGFGVIAGTIAASRSGSSLTGLGIVAVVFGLVWLIEPQAFNDALGVDRATAWLYLAFGAVASAVGLWAPDAPRERVVIRS